MRRRFSIAASRRSTRSCKGMRCSLSARIRREVTWPYGELHAMGEMRRIVTLEGDGTFRLNLEFFRHHRERIDDQHERYRVDALALAGGCGMNSVANGKVYRNTPFKRLYVQSAAGDAGGAIRAAFVVWHEMTAGGSRHGGINRSLQLARDRLFSDRVTLLITSCHRHSRNSGALAAVLGKLRLPRTQARACAAGASGVQVLDRTRRRTG